MRPLARIPEADPPAVESQPPVRDLVHVALRAEGHDLGVGYGPAVPKHQPVAVFEGVAVIAASVDAVLQLDVLVLLALLSRLPVEEDAVAVHTGPVELVDVDHGGVSEDLPGRLDGELGGVHDSCRGLGDLHQIRALQEPGGHKEKSRANEKAQLSPCHSGSRRKLSLRTGT